MKVEVRLNQIVDADVDIEDVIEAINELPITNRLNFIGQFLNGISTEEILEMSPTNIELCKNYLQRQLNRF